MYCAQSTRIESTREISTVIIIGAIIPKHWRKVPQARRQGCIVAAIFLVSISSASLSMRHRTSLEERLRTYHGWPAGSCQHPEHLAAAGFEYEGTGDRVRCPSCRLRLFDWIHSDPLKQHGKFSEYKCSLYKRISQGQQQSQRRQERLQTNSNIDSPTGEDGSQERNGESDRRRSAFFVPERTHSQYAGSRRSDATRSSYETTTSHLPERFSSKCVDAEPPTQPQCTSETSGSQRVANGISEDPSATAAARWAPGLDMAFIDRPELQRLLRHGADKVRLLHVVRGRLDAGLDILADTEGVRREVMGRRSEVN